MAAKAGARYVAPYVNRMDNYGIDGVRVASEIHRTLRTYDLKADVLAASFKNSEQVLELVRQGVGAITARPPTCWPPSSRTPPPTPPSPTRTATSASWWASVAHGLDLVNDK